MSMEFVEPIANDEDTNECATNFNSFILDSNFIMMNYKNRTSDICAYDKSYKPF